MAGWRISRYVPAFGAHLFLSADTEDVRRALEDGYAAATIFPSVFRNETDELRIAFDGDAVLFSDEAERIYQAAGLAAFAQSDGYCPEWRRINVWNAGGNWKIEELRLILLGGQA